MSGPTILVVAAALYDESGRVLIAQRPPGKHLAGRWEFPGGKVSDGEDELAGLARELREELGVEVTAARPLMRLEHSYSDRDVELSLWIVERYRGTPSALDCQGLKWVAPESLGGDDLLEADRLFVEALLAVLASSEAHFGSPAGVLLLRSAVGSRALYEALTKFPAGVEAALDQPIAAARELRREAASRIVVPEVRGSVGPGPGGGGGKIKF